MPTRAIIRVVLAGVLSLAACERREAPADKKPAPAQSIQSSSSAPASSPTTARATSGVHARATEPAQAEPDTAASQPDDTGAAESELSDHTDEQAWIESVTKTLESRGIKVSVGPTPHPFEALVIANTEPSQSQQHAAGQWRAAGTFVDPQTLAVPYSLIDQATDITVDLGNCEHPQVLGVVGVDAVHRVALIALASPPVGVEPLPIGDMPSPGNRLGHRFIFTQVMLSCGFLAGSNNGTITVLDVRDLQNFGPTPVVDVPFGVGGMGSPIVNAKGELVGLLNEKAGGASCMLFPAVNLDQIQRHEPIPLKQFATRERTPEEQARLLDLQANVLQNNDKYDEAIPLLEQANRLLPHDWNILYDLGVCQDMTDQPKNAIKSLTQSINIEPNFAESQYSKGIVLLKQDQPAIAVSSLKAAVKLDPNYTNALAMLALAYFETGQLDNAVTIGERTITQPACESGHFANLCMMYDQANRPQDCVRVAKLWTQAFPDDPTSWAELGDALLGLDDPSQCSSAARAFQRAIDMGLTDLHTYRMLVVAYGQGGQLDQADHAIDEALKHYPDDELLPKLRAMIARDRADQ